MKHLAERGVPCPHPVMRSDGVLLDELNGKPAALVTCLRGRDINEPSVTQCAELGRVIANMHVAGASFIGSNHDSRDVVWREATANKVFDLLSLDNQVMLTQTLQWLEADGLVHRVALNVVPPHVEYSLTELGVEAAAEVRSLADWIEINLHRVLAHRQDRGAKVTRPAAIPARQMSASLPSSGAPR